MAWYSFDTSSLLNGRRDLLPPATFSTLWAKVEGMIAGGQVRCVEEVRIELDKRDDQISSWARAQAGLFVPLDQTIQVATKEVLLRHSRLMGIGGGRNAADPFVIGFAMAHGGTVVTEESKSGNLERPRIPDVCESLGIPCTKLVGFVVAQGWVF